MTLHEKIATGLGGTLALGAFALGTRRLLEARHLKRIEEGLHVISAGVPFSEALVADLPEPAWRYFLHAIQPGTPLAASVSLSLSGSLAPRPGAAQVEITADEVLRSLTGFVWRAHLRMGLLPVSVTDHYAGTEGAVRIHALGLVPLGNDAGPDIDRASRHRLAAEHVWLPSALLPGPEVSWSAVDADRARVTLHIDGEPVPLTITVDAEGRLQQVIMERYGNVGVPDWQPIPYGFSVEEERPFGGYTIPTKVRGGWWFGTKRYDEAHPSFFQVHDARFH